MLAQGGAVVLDLPRVRRPPLPAALRAATGRGAAGRRRRGRAVLPPALAGARASRSRRVGAATPAAAPADTKSRLCVSVRKYLKI